MTVTECKSALHQISQVTTDAHSLVLVVSLKYILATGATGYCIAANPMELLLPDPVITVGANLMQRAVTFGASTGSAGPALGPYRMTNFRFRLMPLIEALQTKFGTDLALIQVSSPSTFWSHWHLLDASTRHTSTHCAPT